MFVIALGTFMALMLAVILAIFLRFCQVSCCSRLYTKIEKFFLWNFVIRLVLEAALEISFCAYLNLRYGHISSHYFGEVFNYVSTLILGSALVFLCGWIVVFYLQRFDQLEDEDFIEKYGDVYEGLKPKQKSSLAFPVYFIIRRMAFMVITFLLIDFVLIQLFALLFLTMAATCYILHFLPFEEPLMNKLEVMNESFTIFLIYTLFCFTDITGNVQDRYLIGFIFIGATVGCISVHLYFIFTDIAKQLYYSIKSKLAQFKSRLTRRNSKLKTI